MSALPPANEWDTPTYGSAPDALRRAAVFTWITGATEMALFGCCAVSLVMLRMIPLGQLQVQATQQSQPIPPAQLAVYYHFLFPASVAVVIAGFLPGLAYLLLGFGVRQGQRISIYFALLLTIMQVIVLATLLLSSIAQAVMTGNAQNMTLAVLMMGSVLGLIGTTAYWLFRAKAAAPRYAGPFDPPWNPPPNNPPPPPPPPDAPEGPEAL